ncbi:Abi family protein [Enterococcus sp. 2201sp1_2201st1_B8_2201SCRN_220225]|uniref:Abi family protein n=1 Tax=unclassified Enterococcus TaxID=2608891 RepID=UPI0034A4F08F
MPSKQHQLPLSVEAQIKNLQELNLTFNDLDFATSFLNDVSYYRFIKAYSLGLKPRNGQYYDGVTFEQIVELYLFNANFRQKLFCHIEKIEVNLRTRIANHFSVKYGSLAYLDSHYFVNEDYHTSFIKTIEKGITRNRRSPFVKNFQDKYEDGSIPLYALVEIMSFGTLSKFFKNLYPVDKREIAISFNTSFKFLESWIESIAYVRNLCAHYGRLYNAILTKKPMLYNEYRKLGIRNDRIFGVICCLKEIIPQDGHWNDFIEEIEQLLIKYPHVDKRTMGFPNNWKTVLLNSKDQI